MSSPSLNLEVKPLAGARPAEQLRLYPLHAARDGGDVYDNHELISRWNYQLTKAASFNLIGQYISTLPHEESTDLPNSKTLFADALFTYMPHPGTALYVGYIGNFANIDRVAVYARGERRLQPAGPDSAADVFVADERRQDHLRQGELPAALLMCIPSGAELAGDRSRRTCTWDARLCDKL